MGQQSVAAAKKKSAAAPLKVSNHTSAAAGERTIEETYVKKTQLEHILLRPDTYVGSVEKQTAVLWVKSAMSYQMEARPVTYVPGLYKIFDEILVNAADNKQRDNTMDTLKVDINAQAGTIKVWNNGAGVPVEVMHVSVLSILLGVQLAASFPDSSLLCEQMHAEEKVYVPEMIFGHLLTSSNYNDSERKTTGGRNGYGAKLANIFSTEFIVESSDSKRGRKYRQVFNDNMSRKTDPAITACKAGEDFTCISFKPDLAKFGMTELEADTVALMEKRVVDTAGCLGKTVKVFLNGECVPVKSFSDYIDLYIGKEQHRVYERVNNRWEVCVTNSDGQFCQVSFVNSIATLKGGTHVNHVTDQVIEKVLTAVKKKDKNAGTIKPFQVKGHLWVFVNALVENPAFDSQTKETLTTKASSFGSSCPLTEEFLKKVLKCGVVEAVLSWATFKQSKELKKTDGNKRSGRLTGIAKLDDANDAGGRNAETCTLILTEGDSAKSLAVSGLSVVGRDRYGVFPLRGKLLNVREASHKQIMDNAEISAIKQILGLQHDKVYTDRKSLRYGSLMIMTDQDHDGSHIKGLLINFLHTFWPSLLRIPGFLLEFITPIVKATKGNQSIPFYTVPQYDAWREQNPGKAWQIKYYKGLGTSTQAEAKEYFAALARHRKSFFYVDEHDDAAIDLAFSKKKAEQRKSWLKDVEPGTHRDHATEDGGVRYVEFVNKELILFSLADLERSIPSMVDGFKPGQRKIVFSCFKRNLKKDIKVAQLAGYVAEQSAYHHGEVSLAGTIVGLAQDYIGANNINLLVPSGQFGTRLQGGKDAASPRYIYTRLSPLARALIPQQDDPLLYYLQDDGQQVEPSWYVPVVPLVLVNGAEGIGTGWSTFVPNFNPRDLVRNIKNLLEGRPQEEIHPWYRGFTGSISPTPGKEGMAYTVAGAIKQLDDVTLEISELPLRKWTQASDYKEFLESMLVGSALLKNPEDGIVRDFKEHHTDVNVRFTVTLSEEGMTAALATGLEKKFKLTTSISLSNMHLFNAQGKIAKYDSPLDVIKEFYTLRLEYYNMRKASLEAAKQEELRKLDNRVRFILAVVQKELEIRNRKKEELLKELKQRKFDPFPKQQTAKNIAAAAEGEDDADSVDGEESSEAAGGRADYDYLLSMPLWSLTHEKVCDCMNQAARKEVNGMVAELLKQKEQVEGELALLQATTSKQMWTQDLDAFMVALDGQDAQDADDAARLAVQQAKAGGAGAKSIAAKPRAPKKTAPAKNTAVDMVSDDDFAAPNKAPVKPKPQPQAAAAPPPSVPAPEPAPSTAAAPKRRLLKSKAATSLVPGEAPSTITASAPVDLDDSDEDGTLSLLARLSLKQAQSSTTVQQPAAPVMAPATASSVEPVKKAPVRKPRAKKTAALTVDSEEESEVTAHAVPVKAAPKPRAKKQPARAQAVSLTDSDVDLNDANVSSDNTLDYAGGSSKPAAKKAPIKALALKLKAQPAAGKKASSKVTQSSGITDLTDSAPVVAAGGSRPRRAALKKYVEVSDSDDAEREDAASEYEMSNEE
eukprot:jgi/Chlat1/4238/Chrsp27S04322